MEESVIKLTNGGGGSNDHHLPMNEGEGEGGGVGVEDTRQSSVSPSQLCKMKSEASSISEEEECKSGVGVGGGNQRSIGVLTDTQDMCECAEPGSSILLEGVVWNETNKGVLILNVKWRGKTYVGSLIDTAKSSWASPRFKDFPKLKSSPSSASLNGPNGNGFSSIYTLYSSYILPNLETYL